MSELLRDNPKLLEYTLDETGTFLKRGNARASVEQWKDRLGVSYWREGASFGSAPVSPMVPRVMKKE